MCTIMSPQRSRTYSYYDQNTQQTLTTTIGADTRGVDSGGLAPGDTGAARAPHIAEVTTAGTGAMGSATAETTIIGVATASTTTTHSVMGGPTEP